MKFQTALGALLALAVAASAAPVSSVSKTVELSGNQLKGVLSALGKGDLLAANQVITCSVAYTLALSTTGPPYTIDLTTLDLSNCTYSGP
ncbi:uncharacterized protein N7482_010344 [Penicillium canariense]|uniref:Uncharacterized protein n=1 Tax=Penicillium canariense TaxID=189055 RepID=A0A9W9HMS8_9EURO|nr:uncharacterized protein N7482_010344 [Penicillium canariense]KAJ5151092.1 hypothetical protein N7482_010344 [Penicillium canariense]